MVEVSRSNTDIEPSVCNDLILRPCCSSYPYKSHGKRGGRVSNEFRHYFRPLDVLGVFIVLLRGHAIRRNSHLVERKGDILRRRYEGARLLIRWHIDRNL